MGVTTRRAMLGGAAVLAGGTVAAATLLRKPPPTIYTPQATPALRGIDALVPVEPAAPLPPFRFSDAEGNEHSLAEFGGKGVVLNLWATWCVPCVAELPSLAALAGKLASLGIVVLPLSTDRGGAETVTKFYAAHGIVGLGIWLDPKGAVSEALHARGLPTTLILDRQGRERARLEGGADWASNMAVATVEQLAA
jgi:thiol-disulfide isomerase/thioredoxin